MLCGIWTFAAFYVELFFIMGSIWTEQYYDVFGILLLTSTTVIAQIAGITVLMNYFQLCGGDYHWWWRSFINGGASAFSVFGYSFAYFQVLGCKSGVTYILYFSIMTLVSFGIFVMFGSV